MRALDAVESALDDDAAKLVLETTAAEYSLPTVDPIRIGVASLKIVGREASPTHRSNKKAPLGSGAKISRKSG